MTEGSPKQILLIAPDLLGESLSFQLAEKEEDLVVLLSKEQLSKQPCLVIWSVDNIEVPTAIQIELQRLQEYWKPTPILLILPPNLQLSSSQLLQFDCPGLLQDPDLETLRKAIYTLRNGGRVVRLKEQVNKRKKSIQPTMGLVQWLLLSGVQQINNDLNSLEILLAIQQKSLLTEILLNGRRRELMAAKSLLFKIWGPLKLSLDNKEATEKIDTNFSNLIGATVYPLQEDGTSISLTSRNSQAVWNAIHERLDKALQKGLINSTGEILAIEALNPSRQIYLLASLVEQLDQVIERLRSSTNKNIPYEETWSSLQHELRQQALLSMAGSYVRLPFKGKLIPVGSKLSTMSDLSATDDELPSPTQMLDGLLVDKPMLVDGQLLPTDDPRAIIQLENYISNWLIRTSELISSEAIEACAKWPELRSYILKPDLVSTRELERLRNQLNSQSRWQTLIELPIQLYESKRRFYKLNKGNIEVFHLTEPRDDELRNLGWWQQQVALLVEARDALSPQIQSFIKQIGDLMVILLTQVIGRAIGLIGRGVAQGMGRSLGKS